MPSIPVANTTLQSAVWQLQKANQLLSGKNNQISKFGDELLKNLNQTSTQQQQNLTAQTSSRPMTFIPATGESAAQTGNKNTTSKRNNRKKSQSESSGSIFSNNGHK